MSHNPSQTKCVTIPLHKKQKNSEALANSLPRPPFHLHYITHPPISTLSQHSPITTLSHTLPSPPYHTPSHLHPLPSPPITAPSQLTIFSWLHPSSCLATPPIPVASEAACSHTCQKSVVSVTVGVVRRTIGSGHSG